MHRMETKHVMKIQRGGYDLPENNFFETTVATLATVDIGKILELLILLTTFLLPLATLVALLYSFAIVMDLLISFKSARS